MRDKIAMTGSLCEVETRKYFEGEVRRNTTRRGDLTALALSHPLVNLMIVSMILMLFIIAAYGEGDGHVKRQLTTDKQSSQLLVWSITRSINISSSWVGVRIISCADSNTGPFPFRRCNRLRGVIFALLRNKSTRDVGEAPEEPRQVARAHVAGGP